MRLQVPLNLFVLLCVAQAKVRVVRQDSGSSIPDTTPISTTPPTNTPSSSATEGDQDTTVFVTQFITLDNASTVTKTTTTDITTTRTVVDTKTEFSTTTVTSSDQDTATRTVFVTTTQIVNAKRDQYADLRTLPIVHAVATPAPALVAVDKRALVTEVATVTVGGGGATTVTETITRTVVTRKSSLITTTQVITETDQVNAKTTITTTSTITVKSTAFTSGVQTETSTPTNAAGSGSSDSGGLSTGAKAGIGAGVGIAGLAVIAGIIWFCLRRRRSPKAEPDYFAGASEVPVGSSGGGGSPSGRPMSQNLAGAAAFRAPGRAPTQKPTIPNISPEGYRGTAMGDGRTGYAKPEAFGSAYANGPSRTATTVSHPATQYSGADSLPVHPAPGDSNHDGAVGISPNTATPSPGPPMAAELGSETNSAARWHTDNAAEIDSRPVMSHQSGPVYEMSAQNYR